MEQTVTTKPRPRIRRQKNGCCDEFQCESGLRNNYYLGKRLTPDMFRVEQRYFVERRHLLNRALYGPGVVYGYGLVTGSLKEAADGRVSRHIRVLPGLAFDECGRELLQVGDLKLDLDDVVVIGKDGKRVDRDKLGDELRQESGSSGDGYRRKKDDKEYGDKKYDDKNYDDDRRVCWRLSVHYAEQRDGHVTVPDPCDCDRHEWDRVCETVRYSLQRIDCDDCCVDDDCSLDCDCGRGHCCDPERRRYDTRNERDVKEVKEVKDVKDEPRPSLPFRRGGCRCLCDHVIDLDIDAACTTRLIEIEEPCGRVYVDLTHGVPIACLGVISDDCGGWTFGEAVDTCGPRKLVARTDVLFDLIRGCDLTRISEIGWGTSHRQAVSFDEFSRMMGAKEENKHEYVLRDFWVKFSRPVREATLLPDCFAMTVLSVDTEGGWWNVLRVPVRRLDTKFVPAVPGDPDGHVRGIRVVVDGSWFEDGFWGRHSVFFAGETSIEIEVRGDLIVDCNGQPVDADAVGLLPAPTGNGTPGGTFLSSIRVGARPSAKGASS